MYTDAIEIQGEEYDDLVRTDRWNRDVVGW